MLSRSLLLAISLFMLGLDFVAAEDKKAEEVKMTPAEKEILELTNKARAAENLPPLQPNPKLFQAARAHTENMAKQEKLSHELDGKKPADRVKAAGYVYRETGENIAEGENVTANDIVNGWLKSKAHRENLLKPAFTEIGLGVAKDAKGRVYYTQEFGLPRK